jgi:D-alanyl-lipoteichoic acid acyltransferase DltB (MBOAT superfamily)
VLFNSQAFLFFLPAVFLVYWAMDRAPLRLQNLFLLSASYVFYGRWDWRFLGLLFATSLVDFLLGLALDRARSPRARRLLLGVSLFVNLGSLAFFKYFDFFVDSFAALLESSGLHPHLPALRVILPVGISFYTFQSLSYTIDVYRGRIRATRDPFAFLAFVSFFPQLVAGPIGRASEMLPQFLARRTFDPAQAADGLRQVLWGFVKKVVVADNLTSHVEAAFSGQAGLGAGALWTGAFFFAIQIYCDFSGYSDIAIGTARLFGIGLRRNFAYPYFSSGIADFWRRWHMSLSSWFRDYVFIPLGGSRVGPARHALNVMATFTLSGLWHGARWTFVAWGALHGLYYLGSMRLSRAVRMPKALGIATTFFAVLLAWVFFRADSMTAATRYLAGMVGLHSGAAAASAVPIPLLLLCLALLGIEGVQSSKAHALDVSRWPAAARWSAYYALVLVIFLAGNLHHVPFIYFQF